MPFLVNFGGAYMDEKHIKDSLAQALAGVEEQLAKDKENEAKGE